MARCSRCKRKSKGNPKPLRLHKHRGMLLCADCLGVGKSLGEHISGFLQTVKPKLQKKGGLND